MEPTDLESLKAGIGRQVVLGFRDGEATLAEPILVSDEDSVVIYDVVWTNRPERYERSGAAYQASLSDIDAVADTGMLSALIGVVFAPEEQPVFIDSNASVEEITDDAEKFALRVREVLGVSVDATKLAMTVPELALHVRRLKR